MMRDAAGQGQGSSTQMLRPLEGHAATRRITQMSLQFLRWLRHHLRKQSSYAESLLDLRPFMESYHL